MDKANFMGRVVKVDKFDDAGNILALLCDESYFQVWDNKSLMTQFYNGEGLYWQYMWHHWETFAVSPFANAIAYVKTPVTTTVVPTSITATPSSVTLKVGDTVNIGLTYEPANTTDQRVGFTSSDESVAVVSEENGRITATKVGTSTITITAKGNKGTEETPSYATTTVSVTVTE